MQRKVTWVLILITSLLIILDLMQLVWMYSNYKKEKEQYLQLLTNCIGDAAQMYQLRNIRSSRNQAATFYIVTSSNDLNYVNENNFLSFSGSNILIDSIQGGLGHSQLIQMQTRNHFDFRIFDSIFKKVLVDNGITSPYKLDTVHSVQSRKSSVTDSAKRVKSFANAKLVRSKAEYPVTYKDYPLRTASMMVNTYGDIFVYASFKPLPSFVLNKLTWPLLLSFIIFLITNFALVFVIKTIRQQKKMNDIKNDFINNMTHELRTPITIATTALDSILSHHGLDDKEKTRSYLEMSKGELIHLDHLVEKILNIAVEEQREIKLHYEAIDINQLISRIAGNHKLLASKDVEFIFPDENKALTIYADRIHVANAINNIIDNAIKYSGEKVLITIDIVHIKDNIEVTISDNGAGIPKEFLPELFTPFFRVPKGNRHDVKGFGLGLSYVKKIMEAHKGSVSVNSRLNEGSSFILVIPTNAHNE